MISTVWFTGKSHFLNNTQRYIKCNVIFVPLKIATHPKVLGVLYGKISVVLA